MNMVETKFALTLDSYQNSICSGLSALQQNGELVDMTLAADGYSVKVHQLILSLVSPYIKELLTSARCQHPIIFLNQISHKTLCSLLEYIYTGEALVTKEDLNELLQAGKALRIKGFDEMSSQGNVENIADKLYTKDIITNFTNMSQMTQHVEINSMQNEFDDDTLDHDISHIFDDAATDMECDNLDSVKTIPEETIGSIHNEPIVSKGPATLQYTISNQGNLQLILNRFLYYLRYSTKKAYRRWQCVEYINNFKCPAWLATKNEMIVKRVGTHNHPFHDRRILNKIQSGTVYAAIHTAEEKGKIVKKDKKSSGEQSQSFDENE